jgi:hypothetical protein
MNNRTYIPRTSRALQMHRSRAGFYVRRETSTSVLHVFKYNRRWYYARRPYQVLSSKVAALFLSLPGWTEGYPTYAMALSAAQGNRVS